MLHHMRQTFLDLYVDFGSDFPKSVITLGITLLKELQKFEEKSTAAKRYMSGHASSFAPALLLFYAGVVS